MKRDTLRAYVLPGLVFQSVVIAGGYGTGRELAEFFLFHGPVEGLMGMLLVSTLLWSLVCAVTFEFARAFKAYDYRRFFKHLLGRGWILFEICYLILLLLVLAVIASAAGSILQETFGLPYLAGVVGIMLAVGFLVFKGSSAIEGFLSVWSLVLYLIYAAFLAACFWYFGDAIRQAFQTPPQGLYWVLGGVKYAAYNLGVIPAVLFVIRHIQSRRQAIGAGLLAGPIAMMPGLFFYLAMASQYPEVLQRPVPANALLEALGSQVFQITFQVVLFGTLIETGSGMIHAVNERVSNLMQERNRVMPSWQRFTLGLGLLLMGALIAQYGLIGLIAQGYGTITWGFLLVYVIPILTWGIVKLRSRRSD